MSSYLLQLLSKVRTSSGANSRIARGVGVVALFVFIGRIAGALKEMAVAYRFGVSEIVDAYTLAFTMSSIAPMVWTVVLASVFIPLSKRLDTNERVAFVRQLTGFSILLGGLFALLIGLVMPLLVPYIWTDISTASQAYIQQLFVGLSPMVLAKFLAALFAAQLLVLEHHSNTLMEALPSLILAVVILIANEQSTLSPFITGTLFGVFAQLLGLYLILKSTGYANRVEFGFDASAWRMFRNAIGIMAVGQFIMSMAIPLDYYFASQLGEGAVSSYGYAYRILLLFLGIGATATSRAILPVLSDIKDNADKHRIAFKWAGLLFCGGCLMALAAWLVMPWMVKLIFERGAFNASDSQNVTLIIRFGLLQLPPYFAGIVLVQLLLSVEKFGVVFWSSALALTVKVIAGYIGAQVYGLPGIMGSWFFVYLATLLFLSFHVNRIALQSDSVKSA